MTELQADAVLSLARSQRDLMIVSSLDEENKEGKERGKSSRLTSSSILLALHSPFLASLLHPGTDGLSLPFALDTIASLLAWLHGEVDSIEEEQVEEAAVWLGFQVHHRHRHQHHHHNHNCHNHHLYFQVHQPKKLRRAISMLKLSKRRKARKRKESVEEAEKPECDRQEVLLKSQDVEDQVERSSPPPISNEDTMDALSFDFSEYSEYSFLSACDQLGPFECDQCGQSAATERDLIRHRCVLTCYSCNECDFESNRLEDLKKHMHSKHESLFIKLISIIF